MNLSKKINSRIYKDILFLATSLLLIFFFHYTYNILNVSSFFIDSLHVVQTLKLVLLISYILLAFFVSLTIRNENYYYALLSIIIGPWTIISFISIDFVPVTIGYLIFVYLYSRERKITWMLFIILQLFPMFLFLEFLLGTFNIFADCILFLWLIILWILIDLNISISITKTILGLALIASIIQIVIDPGKIITSSLQLDKELVNIKNNYIDSYAVCFDANSRIILSYDCIQNITFAEYAVIPNNFRLKIKGFQKILSGKYYSVYKKIPLNIKVVYCPIK